MHCHPRQVASDNYPGRSGVLLDLPSNTPLPLKSCLAHFRPCGAKHTCSRTTITDYVGPGGNGSCKPRALPPETPVTVLSMRSTRQR